MSDRVMTKFYWPGPTRLYDADVDCGAPLMTGGQATALVRAAESFIAEHPDDERVPIVRTALKAVRFTFLIGGE